MKKPVLILGLIAAAALASPANAAAWEHYSDIRHGWSISYPANWKINRNYVSAALGPDHEIKGVSFTIPASFQPGTNLSHNDTAISIENVAGRYCMPARFVDPAENVHQVRVRGRLFWAADSEDAGAGNRYETHVFVLGERCLAVRYFIHSTAVENYDPGTIKAFNAKKLIAAFDAIRETLSVMR